MFAGVEADGVGLALIGIGDGAGGGGAADGDGVTRLSGGLLVVPGVAGHIAAGFLHGVSAQRQVAAQGVLAAGEGAVRDVAAHLGVGIVIDPEHQGLPQGEGVSGGQAGDGLLNGQGALGIGGAVDLHGELQVLVGPGAAVQSDLRLLGGQVLGILLGVGGALIGHGAGDAVEHVLLLGLGGAGGAAVIAVGHMNSLAAVGAEPVVIAHLIAGALGGQPGVEGQHLAVGQGVQVRLSGLAGVLVLAEIPAVHGIAGAQVGDVGHGLHGRSAVLDVEGLTGEGLHGVGAGGLGPCHAVDGVPRVADGGLAGLGEGIGIGDGHGGIAVADGHFLLRVSGIGMGEGALLAGQRAAEAGAAGDGLGDGVDPAVGQVPQNGLTIPDLSPGEGRHGLPAALDGEGGVKAAGSGGQVAAKGLFDGQGAAGADLELEHRQVEVLGVAGGDVLHRAVLLGPGLDGHGVHHIVGGVVGTLGGGVGVGGPVHDALAVGIGQIGLIGGLHVAQGMGGLAEGVGVAQGLAVIELHSIGGRLQGHDAVHVLVGIVLDDVGPVQTAEGLLELVQVVLTHAVLKVRPELVHRQGGAGIQGDVPAVAVPVDAHAVLGQQLGHVHRHGEVGRAVAGGAEQAVAEGLVDVLGDLVFVQAEHAEGDLAVAQGFQQLLAVLGVLALQHPIVGHGIAGLGVGVNGLAAGVAVVVGDFLGGVMVLSGAGLPGIAGSGVGVLVHRAGQIIPAGLIKVHMLETEDVRPIEHLIHDLITAEGGDQSVLGSDVPVQIGVPGELTVAVPAVGVVLCLADRHVLPIDGVAADEAGGVGLIVGLLADRGDAVIGVGVRLGAADRGSGGVGALSGEDPVGVLGDVGGKVGALRVAGGGGAAQLQGLLLHCQSDRRQQTQDHDQRQCQGKYALLQSFHSLFSFFQESDSLAAGPAWQRFLADTSALAPWLCVPGFPSGLPFQ